MLLLRELVKNSIINIEQIEAVLDKLTDNWDLEDIALLDRSILCISIYELLYTDTPARLLLMKRLKLPKNSAVNPQANLLTAFWTPLIKKLFRTRKRIYQFKL